MYQRRRGGCRAAVARAGPFSSRGTCLLQEEAVGGWVLRRNAREREELLLGGLGHGGARCETHVEGHAEGHAGGILLPLGSAVARAGQARLLPELHAHQLNGEHLGGALGLALRVEGGGADRWQQ